jgi:shikimate kinase
MNETPSRYQRLFIIGPAGVGKSTCGPLLAEKLGFSFCDLDVEFKQRYGDIEHFVKTNSYLKYCQTNTEVFLSLVDGQKRDTVFSVSSGFLMYEEVDPSFASNALVLDDLGISILLLPSHSMEQSLDIVIGRILARRPWLSREKETKKFIDRFVKYMQHGDIRIFSTAPPDLIADMMVREYRNYISRHNELPI